MNTIDALKQWQNFFFDIHPTVQKEIITLALVLFRDAEKCVIDAKLPDLVSVKLVPYSGVKGFVNKYIKRYPKEHKENAKKLIQGIDFWVPFDGKGRKPRIEVLFGD